jgi:hypothetical protein
MDGLAASAQMRKSEKRARIAVTAVYFIVCFGGLFYYTYGSSFCSRPGGPAHLVQTFRLTIACTTWGFIAGVCGKLPAKKTANRWLAPSVSALLAFLGFASIPFWIYRGFPQGFLFDGTWADVSCFFTEGYGFMFPILISPALALATFLGELIVLKASGHGQSGLNPAQGAP